MTPEAQRIAIAEACGWRAKNAPFPGAEKCFMVCDSGGVQRTHVYTELAQAWIAAAYVLPDYLSDLNAMHEAEKALRDDEGPCGSLLCRDYLNQITNGLGWHATAAQRAEAFLKTISKWEESA